MNELLENTYKRINDALGLPQTYKNIEIFPIKIKDVDFRSDFYGLIAYPKNSIPDKKILKMSYFKFIVFSNIFEDTEIRLTNLIKYLTRNKEVRIETKLIDPKKEIEIENIALRLVVGETEFNEEEFDIFREIVLEQNGLSIKFVEDFHPELEEKLFAFSKGNELDINDEIFILSAMMQKLPQDFEELTIYQLDSLMERISILKEFEMYKPLEVSGQITIKNGEIRSYLYHMSRKGRYDSILIGKDKFVEKNKGVLS